MWSDTEGPSAGPVLYGLCGSGKSCRFGHTLVPEGTRLGFFFLGGGGGGGGDFFL